ncbi:Cof-type HAD-IIB family hydrolase [Morganella psychrotolerans]|uniref:Cof-type HAD-IIB family hydrolase n=1 Tax=Morganella psychrotolerans TaxID=368603 RepID=UPI0039AEFA50
MTTLAIDLDGTLLHPDNYISEANRQALLALPAETNIVICSARPLQPILSLLDDAGLRTVIRAVGAFNGAVIYDYRTHSVLSKTTLCPVVLSRLQPVLHADLNSASCGWHAFTTDALLCLPGERSEHTTHEAALFNLPVNTVTADELFSRTDILKITLCGDAEELALQVQTLRPELPSALRTFFTDQHYFELVPLSVSKGAAVHELTEKGIIPPGTVIAIGDQENDLSLFEAADIRVAMGNAVPALKQHADFITGTCRDNGVAAALRHFISAFRNGG